MRNILIIPKLKLDKYNQKIFQVDIKLINYLQKINFFPIIFSSLNVKKIHKEIKKNKILAVIFQGGGDIYKIKKRRENFIRDAYEYNIMKNCIKNKIKILCICRAMQLFASHHNSKLFKISGHARTKHFVILNNIKIKVNSFHNYAIKKINNKFNTIGLDKNLNIEIISDSLDKVLCTMFHPERINPDQKKVDKIIKQFLLNK